MKKIGKTVLLTDDLSTTHAQDKKRRALTYSWANFLSKLLKTQVDIIHSENLDHFPIKNTTYKNFFKLFIKKQNSLLKSSKAASHSFLTEGSPVDNILKLASRANSYEMIVVGTHGRKYLNRLFLGSVSEEIIRHSKIPVLTVGTQTKNPSAISSNEIKIVLATDLGPNSGNAEKYARSLAEKLNAQIVLVHCLFEGFHPVLQTAFSSPSANQKLSELYEKIKKETQTKLKMKCKKEFLARGVRCSIFLDTTSPSAADSILKVTQQFHATLIVAGTHGRNYIANSLLGSTARRLILKSNVPVITVRSR